MQPITNATCQSGDSQMASGALPRTNSIPRAQNKRKAALQSSPPGLSDPSSNLSGSRGDAPILIALLSEARLPLPVAEYQFARELTPPRRWRFDYAWRAERIALEIEGAIWQQGRHTRGGGYRGDIEKYNAAALAGWLVLRCTYDMLQNEQAIDYLRAAFALRASQTVSPADSSADSSADSQSARDASSTSACSSCSSCSSCVNASVTSGVPQLTQTSVTGDSYGRPLERAILTTPAAAHTKLSDSDSDSDGRCGRRERQRERRRDAPARAGL